MSIFRNDLVWASCTYLGDGTAFVTNRGFSALGDTGTGNALLTLDAAIAAADRLTLVTAVAPAIAQATIVDTSTTQIQVRIWDDAGVAKDATTVGVVVLKIATT